MAMNSRQRMAAAMRHETPDRVPVMCQLALGHFFIHGKEKPSDVWFDSAAYVRTICDFRRRYGFDGFLINLPGRPANWRDALQNYERNSKGETLTWKSGLRTFVPCDDNAYTLTASGDPLPRADYQAVSADDMPGTRTLGYVWNTFHAPSLWDIPAQADLADPASYPDWFTLPLRLARAAEPEASVHQEVFSPFTHLMEVFGYETALMALMDEPQKCHAMLQAYTAQVIAELKCFAPHGADAVLISSAFAGAGFISRDMYREFVVPYEKQVVAEIRRMGVPSYVHTCGAIGDRLDLMAESGLDGVDTLDPPPLGTVDLAKAKADFGKRFFFKGNLDAVNEMLRADDATFAEAVRKRLEIGMPGGGYILSSACSVAPRVEPGRLVKIVEMAERWGRYA
ncbi:MAG: hypothetical protein IT440_11895 [Phycisphaeraceae bacterium]|nr:hypothetical protein [Phycisphaeraceae bacterium]